MATILTIEAKMAYDFEAAADLLLQVELARVAGQDVREDRLFTTPVNDFTRVPAEQAFGTRAWMQAEGRFEATYRATVAIDRPDPGFESLTADPPRALTGEATGFLMPSRYCPSDEFEAFVSAEFAGLSGGPLILAIRDWIGTHFTYVAGVSTAATTARESFVQRRGVCRDYAHVMVALARAAGIPARVASGYAPRVDPPDFHLVAEVWLEDAWHLVDPTGMASASELALVGVGRDAADVSFLTSYGLATLVSQTVAVAAG
ncbi:transglutaminase-like domain-containing protein [Jannaschia ovalis]|uniref:Transglutaminase family protein n=1 Tax=Jannaschia ovalis TaxID=3038773 RepID=A0ABY8LDM0_9RHOB|nr:transglutaminase family protein [Jannaschia sp. GRR-S6-38]WGH79419.1 transglutaminase family protein [Jannaschia sp. GRR-S6-38]